MQVPDQILAERERASAKVVLDVLWRGAEGEPAWTATRVADLVERTGLARRTVFDCLKKLQERGAVRRETRRVAGRDVLGFGLSRAMLPLQKRVRQRSRTTAGARTMNVAKREKSHASVDDRMLADLTQIAKHSRPGDSRVEICRRLNVAGAPCSDTVRAGVSGTVSLGRVSGGRRAVIVTPEGEEPRTHYVVASRPLLVTKGQQVRAGEKLVEGVWHKIKVHRRIVRIAEELGLDGKRLKAGDIVERWKKTR